MNISTEPTPIDERKEYEKPEILHELDLETRAGSKAPIPMDAEEN